MAPFSLLDYDSTQPWVRSIKENRDPSLSAIEIATIAKWVDKFSALQKEQAKHSAEQR